MSLLVSRSARRDLDIAPELVDGGGRVLVPSFTIARRLAATLGRPRVEDRETIRAPTAGDLVALALLDDIYRALLNQYLERRDSTVLGRVLQHLSAAVGVRETADLLERFGKSFGLDPESRVDLDAEEGRLRRGRDSGRVDQELLFEFVLFWLHWRNPAAKPLVSRLHRGFPVTSAVRVLFDQVESFLATCEGMLGSSLADDLMAPATTHPDSLAAQLDFVKRVWEGRLGDELLRLQGALDLMAEEAAPRWAAGGGPPSEAPGLPVDGEEQYSADREWMPRLVLGAKNTLVWLHQLSVAYGRDISRLDQIPEAELELLAGRGITGLWLIGLWERSLASSEIKRRRGNPEAAASAYSLRSYRIAQEFGGDEALEVLRRRAARHGVRLAADMVPNHMGIDSDWVLDHPERFVQVDEPPFPAYSFTGPDLSPRSDVGIFLEDHYYDGTDAAVVFKRLDRKTGAEAFIYHGNDGTSMPWNDTAQLDYLDPAVREAVIETILGVARRFSVIRFDAAMTLAKRHYHRLWHPQPGDAGAIPSRSEHGLGREELDRSMPREFWREVVDRAASEAPDTLLLAEAFWLMEGYFVRTLGLHRVYNSAFMHMMRDQETGKYRRLLKETLEFDPEILRRYVNFMSNPDEESAADQFDLGDRYFGICTVLATLPGLPMLAHGQWDGLREKYGMEYRRSYRSESPERHVIERHDREIAPLLRRRAVFADVDRFRLYDFHDRRGNVLEEVLAYSNGRGSENALVVLNNSPHRVTGWLRDFAPIRATAGEAGLEAGTLYDVLPLPASGPVVGVLRDPLRGLNALTAPAGEGSSRLDLELGPFSVLVFTEFETIEGGAVSWRELADALAGRPVTDLALEMALFRAEPLLGLVSELAELLRTRLVAGAGGESDLREACERHVKAVDKELARYLDGPPFERTGNRRAGEAATRQSAKELRALVAAVSDPAMGAQLERCRGGEPTLCTALVMAPVFEAVEKRTREAERLAGLGQVLVENLGIGAGPKTEVSAMLALAMREDWLGSGTPPGVTGLLDLAADWADDPDARRLMGANVADEVEWLTLEGLRLLLAARTAFAVGAASIDGGEPAREDRTMVGVGWRLAGRALESAAANAEYRLRRWPSRVAARGRAPGLSAGVARSAPRASG